MANYYVQMNGKDYEANNIIIVEKCIDSTGNFYYKGSTTNYSLNDLNKVEEIIRFRRSWYAVQKNFGIENNVIKIFLSLDCIFANIELSNKAFEKLSDEEIEVLRAYTEIFIIQD